MGKFTITQRVNGLYHFNLIADNGQIILSSEGYTSKSGCINGIESVKLNSKDDFRFDRRISSNGKYYFNLKSSNGQIIGTSEMYNTQDGRENGIESVKKNASLSNIKK